MNNKAISIPSANTLRTEIDLKVKEKQLMNELSKFKRIKVPHIDYSITGEELADWLIDVSTPQEIEQTLLMIKNAQKRGSNIKSILQTIAVGLLH